MYMGSNTEKKPWTNLQKLYKNKAKSLRATVNSVVAVFCGCRRFLFAVTLFRFTYKEYKNNVHIKRKQFK